MCTVCGCGDHQSKNKVGQIHHHHHHHHHGDSHDHNHEHAFGHHHHGKNEAGVSVAGKTTAQLIEIERDILSKNDAFADANRQKFSDAGILALNLVSSPGAGKTTLLESTVSHFKTLLPVGVVEGDQETTNDADRIRSLGVPAIQVNTGRGCHLDAHMVGHAVDELRLHHDGIVFIENVGNLVCPAAFDLGEASKVVILSVTEGDDKPLKYPDMFAAADVLVLSKVDLLSYVPFDADTAIENARAINPDLDVVRVSALTGEGMDSWFDRIADMHRTIARASADHPPKERASVAGPSQDA